MSKLLPCVEKIQLHESNSILIVSSRPKYASWLTGQLQHLTANINLQSMQPVDLWAQANTKWRLVILEAKGSDRESLGMCVYLRQKFPSTPILFLANSQPSNAGLLSLENGADDYICHPVNTVELVARARALLRRTGSLDNIESSRSVIRYAAFSLDKDSRELVLDNQTVTLTNREFELIWFLAKHPNKVFSRSELLDKVWGYNHAGYEHTVNSHINRLRKKLNGVRAKPAVLETVWGIGYKFRAV